MVRMLVQCCLLRLSGKSEAAISQVAVDLLGENPLKKKQHHPQSLL